ncbi:MAG: molybdate ABC transporter substrate-binding protein [Gammaproteobacteria bacterium]|nr:molybdate ABC transporter substrate-binding protein [Gammaproteobacteria bacterium]
MSRPRLLNSLAAACLLLATAGPAAADRIQVAVASNFTGTLDRLAEHFERQSGHQVVLVPGSTGKHYAQIRNGAPFDAFFAADVRRPELLEQEGAAVPGSRFTYAIGKLVLWSPAPGLVDSMGEVLKRGTYRHLAIANPRLAPYGRAAREALQAMELWQALERKLVYGESIGQTFLFVNSGNAELGLVAYAQVKDAGIDSGYWKIPSSLYAPIEQQAVALVDSAATRAFLAYVRSDEALGIIRGLGYDTP